MAKTPSSISVATSNDAAAFEEFAQRLIDEVYRRYRTNKAWPPTRSINLTFKKDLKLWQGLQTVCRRLGFDVIIADSIQNESGVVRLRLTGLVRCSAAAEDLSVLLSVARAAAKTYQTADGVGARQNVKAVLGELGIEEGDLARLMDLIPDLGRFLGVAIGNGVWDVTPFADDLDDVANMEEYLQRQETFNREMLQESGGSVWPPASAGDMPLVDAVDRLARCLGAPRYAGPKEHFEKAREFLKADARDYANAVGEAVRAVEGLARRVTGQEDETLGKLTKTLGEEGLVHPVLAKAFQALWGYRSVVPGIGHGATTGVAVQIADAEFAIRIAVAAAELLLSVDLQATA